MGVGERGAEVSQKHPHGEEQMRKADIIALIHTMASGARCWKHTLCMRYEYKSTYVAIGAAAFFLMEHYMWAEVHEFDLWIKRNESHGWFCMF